MDSAQPLPTSVRIGYRLITLLLIGAALFASLQLVSVGVGVARGGDSLLYGNTLNAPAELTPDALGRALPASLHATGSPGISVTIHDPTTKQMLLRSAIDFGLTLLVIAVLWILRGLIASVIRREPFGDANVRRLRTLGSLFVFAVPLIGIVESALGVALFNTLPPSAGNLLGGPSYTIPGNGPLIGLGAFILAEVFAQGLRLREDVEATI
jgi:Protein of unknown function (DUF2975)